MTLCKTTKCHYAECRVFSYCYGECHYAECHYAECRYAEYHGAFTSKSTFKTMIK